MQQKSCLEGETADPGSSVISLSLQQGLGGHPNTMGLLHIISMKVDDLKGVIFNGSRIGIIKNKLIS
jgi:hypothetical protein